MDDVILSDKINTPSIKVEQMFEDESDFVYSTSIIEDDNSRGTCEIFCKRENIIDDIIIESHDIFPEENEMHIVSEGADDPNHEIIERDTTYKAEEYTSDSVELDIENSPSSSPVHIKVDPSTRKGIQDFTNIFEEHFPSKKEYIKVDKADPRSRLHFLKYMKKDGKIRKIWECGICGKEFFHQYTLLRHLPIHTGERNYECQECGKTFRQMSTLSQHKNVHYDVKPYACEICQKTFSRGSSLISHKRTHSEKKPHICTICAKAFHQKGNLKSHMFTHTQERPFKCDICGKGFNQSSNLLCHKSKVHIPTHSSSLQNANEKYKCRHCSMSYSRRAQLRQHEEYHHNTKVSSSTRGGSVKLNIAPGRNSFLHKKKIGNVRIIQLPNGDKAIQEKQNGILIDPIDTKAMHKALSLGNPPFALLKPTSGLPVIVKVQFAPGKKHMLVCPTASELKAAAKFVVDRTKDGNKSAQIKISIHVVATICQKVDENGEISLEVVPPSDEVEAKVDALSPPVLCPPIPPAITDLSQILQPSFVKSSIDKSKNTIAQHFVLSPSLIKNSNKNPPFLLMDNQDSNIYTTYVGDCPISDADSRSSKVCASPMEVTVLSSGVELCSQEQATIKDNILSMEVAPQYLHPTGVICEYEEVDPSEVDQEAIIDPIKNLFEESGPVTIDPSQFSTLMDVLQNAGYQLQTQSDAEDMCEAVLATNDSNTPHIILKTDDSLVTNEQLLISHDVALEDAANPHEDGISLVVQDGII